LGFVQFSSVVLAVFYPLFESRIAPETKRLILERQLRLFEIFWFANARKTAARWATSTASMSGNDKSLDGSTTLGTLPACLQTLSAGSQSLWVLYGFEIMAPEYQGNRKLVRATVLPVWVQ